VTRSVHPAFDPKTATWFVRHRGRDLEAPALAGLQAMLPGVVIVGYFPIGTAAPPIVRRAADPPKSGPALSATRPAPPGSGVTTGSPAPGDERPVTFGELLAKGAAAAHNGAPAAPPADPRPEEGAGAARAGDPPKRWGASARDPLGLTWQERKATELLLARQMVTRDALRVHLYGARAVGFQKSLPVLISRLRRRLGVEINSSWGTGWYMTPEAKRQVFAKQQQRTAA
jgi:hypothetical protein